MPAILGSGEHRYRVVENWAKLPEGWEFKDVAAVAVDSKDRVYCFNRGEHPMMVFDRGGNFLRSWGEGQYPRAHGVHMAPDDTMFLTDDGGHFMRKVTLDGKVLLEQHLAVECHLAHKMSAIVGQKHRVVGRHMDAVRPRILALA